MITFGSQILCELIFIHISGKVENILNQGTIEIFFSDFGKFVFLGISLVFYFAMVLQTKPHQEEQKSNQRKEIDHFSIVLMLSFFFAYFLFCILISVLYFNGIAFLIAFILFSLFLIFHPVLLHKQFAIRKHILLVCSYTSPFIGKRISFLLVTLGLYAFAVWIGIATENSIIPTPIEWIFCSLVVIPLVVIGIRGLLIQFGYYIA